MNIFNEIQVTKVAGLALILCLILVGCGYNKSTLINLKGDKILVPLKGIGTVEGENITATLNRQVNFTMEPGRKLKIQKNIGDNKETVNIE